MALSSAACRPHCSGRSTASASPYRTSMRRSPSIPRTSGTRSSGAVPERSPIRSRRHVMSKKSQYERLGGYDALTAVANDLLPRLQGDPQLGRFWKNRSDDGIAREKQLLIDYLCASTGGPMYYTGRDMKRSEEHTSE